MKNQDKIKALQTLAELQVDREAGYRKVAEEATVADFDLKVMFQNMANESKKATEFLNAFLAEYGGEKVEHENSFLAEIHQAWIDIKKAVSTRDRKALLGSCEFGENIIIGAYESILEDERLVDAEIRMLLHSQLDEIKKSIKIIEEVKELEKA
ncbi:PA2169 family four-helix-bundle protein [uncultured Arcticibacterium sp.]|uniref:PA2169 family four-helix-bundle protein n=1 Tax=uncultured Arcticibacterium sp. TaxID=2173042 RepID=UPI0030F81CA1